MLAPPTRVVCATALALAALAAPVAADLLDDVTRMAPGILKRASSGLFDPESNADAHHVSPGQNLLLADLEGPGEIRHMWFTLASQDRRYPRNMILRIYWDGSDVPAIESPIGDFFGAGNGMRANIESIPVSVSSYGRALNCYWRMPFRKHARIEIENVGAHRVTCYFQCEWLALQEPPKDALYFHARYRQEYPARPFSTYTIFDGKGEGQYVGTVYSSQNMVGSWFGEADDRFYVDGETAPSLIGTGTEDYFNDAWNLRVHTYGRVGVPICETKGQERRITAYRWHLDDLVPFRKSLRVEIERRSFVYVVDPETGEQTTYDFKYRPDYVSSVAFWYHRGTMERTWEFPDAKELVLPEIWIEPTQLADAARVTPGLRPRVASNRTCNLKRYLYLRNETPGGWMELPFGVEEPGRYAVSVFQNLFHEFGVWKVSLLGPEGEHVLHPALDFWDDLESREENYPENFHHGTTVEKKLGEVHLKPGEHWVRFECIGSNPLSRHPETGAFGQGFSLGLDAINLRRLPIEPYEWLTQYLPEEEALFAKMADEATRTVRKLAEAAQAHRDDEGEYPADLEELARELDLPDGTLLDPWGQPYEYRCPGLVRPWSFDVWSYRGHSRDTRVWIGNWGDPLDLSREAPEGAIVIEGESLGEPASGQALTCGAQRTSALVDAPLSSGALLFMAADKRGAWAEFAMPGEIAPGEYDAYALCVTSWDYGIVSLALDGVSLVRSLDSYSPLIGKGCCRPLRVTVTEKAPVLRVEVEGTSRRSAGLKAGLDALVLVAAED